MQRLFLGIDVPVEVKQFLDQAYAPIRTSFKGWELPHDYHLTLMFIGETNQSDDIIQQLQKIKSRPFELRTKTLEFFPRRILYQSFYPSSELQNLRVQVEKEYSSWVNPNSKPFLPHLTVKRFQRYEYDQLSSLIQAHPFEEVSFEVNELCIFKSEKNQLSQKYHVIFRHQF